MPQFISESRDVSTLPDLDPLFRWVTGARAVGEAVARRLSTPPGTLYGAPDYGYDIRVLLNDTMGPPLRLAIESKCVAEAEADDRELRASARVLATNDPGVVLLRIQIETVDGPAELTLTSDELTANILVTAAEE